MHCSLTFIINATVESRGAYSNVHFLSHTLLTRLSLFESLTKWTLCWEKVGHMFYYNFNVIKMNWAQTTHTSLSLFRTGNYYSPLYRFASKTRFIPIGTIIDEERILKHDTLSPLGQHCPKNLKTLRTSR